MANAKEQVAAYKAEIMALTEERDRVSSMYKTHLGELRRKLKVARVRLSRAEKPKPKFHLDPFEQRALQDGTHPDWERQLVSDYNFYVKSLPDSSLAVDFIEFRLAKLNEVDDD